MSNILFELKKNNEYSNVLNYSKENNNIFPMMIFSFKLIPN